jgi:ketosteroid isomerase-like protein
MLRLREPLRTSLAFALLLAFWGVHPTGHAEESKETKKPTAAKQAEQTYRAYLDAGVKKDEKAMLKLLDEEFILTTAAGTRLGRVQTIALLSAADIVQNPCELSDLRVRLYGDCAVITTQCIESGKNGKIPFRNTMRCTLTVVRKETGWVIVAEHVTKITK